MHALSSEAATAGAAALAGSEPFDAEALYRAHRPGLVRLAHLLTGSATAAEDVVQDAFIGLVRHKRTVREPLAYLRRSVVNLSTNRHRAAARERRHLAVLIDEGVAPPEIDETWRIIKDLPPPPACRADPALLPRFVRGRHGEDARMPCGDRQVDGLPRARQTEGVHVMNANLDDDVIARVRASLSAVAASTTIGLDRWDAVAATPGRRQRPLAVSFSAAAAVVGVVAATAGTAVILTRERDRSADGGMAGSCIHSRSLDSVVATREQLATQFRGLMYMLPGPPAGYHVETSSGGARYIVPGQCALECALSGRRI